MGPAWLQRDGLGLLGDTVDYVVRAILCADEATFAARYWIAATGTAPHSHECAYGWMRRAIQVASPAQRTVRTTFSRARSSERESAWVGLPGRLSQDMIPTQRRRATRRAARLVNEDGFRSSDEHQGRLLDELLHL